MKDLSVSSGIIGGKDLKAGDELTSHIVGIWDSSKEAMCTGTLIEENVVLTAAHCIISKPSQLKIIFDVDFFSIVAAREVDVVEGATRRVVSVKVHEKYEKDPEKESPFDQNDIALIKFAGGLPVGYKPVSLLADSAELDRGQEVTIAGYGISKVDMVPVDVSDYSPQKLEKKLENGSIDCDETLTECFEIEMSGDGFLRYAHAKIKGFTLSEVRLDESHGEGTCNGDSGGPAFLQKDGTYFLFGVTSRGNFLCDKEGVYTNATEHKEWIEKMKSAL